MQNFIKSVSIIIQIVIVILIFYFSWVPGPNLSEKETLPGFLSILIDKFYKFRTAIPFFFLSLFCYPSWKDREFGFAFRLNFTLSFTVVLIAEFGQLFLKQRHFDIKDILWGLFGSYTAFVVIYFIFIGDEN
jgi:glycopeptide antibiotics resistance protein